jgi:hydrogenase maturation factor HypF (carbamoyltransferase family)
MDKLEIEIACPECNREFKQRVEDMRPGKSRKCPGCGVEIKFTGDDGRKAQKALDDLNKSLGKLGFK